eukprot:Hpha_TRINITY_DN18562_c0_g1::TRINITY_DN18562_c0_g1_i1::g.195100::m.195100
MAVANEDFQIKPLPENEKGTNGDHIRHVPFPPAKAALYESRTLPRKDSICEGGPGGFAGMKRRSQLFDNDDAMSVSVARGSALQDGSFRSEPSEPIRCPTFSCACRKHLTRPFMWIFRRGVTEADPTELRQDKRMVCLAHCSVCVAAPILTVVRGLERGTWDPECVVAGFCVAMSALSLVHYARTKRLDVARAAAVAEGCLSQPLLWIASSCRFADASPCLYPTAAAILGVVSGIESQVAMAAWVISAVGTLMFYIAEQTLDPCDLKWGDAPAEPISIWPLLHACLPMYAVFLFVVQSVNALNRERMVNKMLINNIMPADAAQKLRRHLFRLALMLNGTVDGEDDTDSTDDSEEEMVRAHSLNFGRGGEINHSGGAATESFTDSSPAGSPRGLPEGSPRGPPEGSPRGPPESSPRAAAEGSPRGPCELPPCAGENPMPSPSGKNRRIRSQQKQAASNSAAPRQSTTSMSSSNRTEGEVVVSVSSTTLCPTHQPLLTPHDLMNTDTPVITKPLVELATSERQEGGVSKSQERQGLSAPSYPRKESDTGAAADLARLLDPEQAPPPKARTRSPRLPTLKPSRSQPTMNDDSGEVGEGSDGNVGERTSSTYSSVSLSVSLTRGSLFFEGIKSAGELPTMTAAGRRELEKRGDVVVDDQLLDAVLRTSAVFSRRIAVQYNEAAVMFADVVGFTASSSGMDPQDVVRDLHSLVAHIDILCLAYKVQKIKTIGDAYMAWAPQQSTESDEQGHLKGVLEVARRLPDNPAMQLGGRTHAMRVGCHSGRVVAGLIGITKWAWDLWGDAVNTASRMESTGVPNRVQISEAMAVNVRPLFQLDMPRTVKVKGKGKMNTYLLHKGEHAWCYKPQPLQQKSKEKGTPNAARQGTANWDAGSQSPRGSPVGTVPLTLPKLGLPGETNNNHDPES